MGCTLQTFNEAQCVACLKEVYYSVLSSAGRGIKKCRSTIPALPLHLPPIRTQSGMHSLVPAYCIEYNESIIYCTVQLVLPDHYLACETGTWRRRNDPASIGSRRVLLLVTLLDRSPAVWVAKTTQGIRLPGYGRHRVTATAFGPSAAQPIGGPARGAAVPLLDTN
jgi:hypothetical protein